MKKTNNNLKGQIIIEALIGLALVSICLVALMSLSLKSLRVQLLNKQWNQAGQLEQEAMEAIRQIRDGNGFVKIYPDQYYDWAWDNSEHDIWETSGATFFRLYFDEPAQYWVLEKIDDQQTSTPDDPHDSQFRLAYDIATNRFGYTDLGGFPSTAVASPFFRQIMIQDNPGLAKSKSVTTTLSFLEKGIFHETKLISIFSDW